MFLIDLNVIVPNEQTNQVETWDFSAPWTRTFLENWFTIRKLILYV